MVISKIEYKIRWMLLYSLLKLQLLYWYTVYTSSTIDVTIFASLSVSHTVFYMTDAVLRSQRKQLIKGIW